MIGIGWQSEAFSVCRIPQYIQKEIGLIPQERRKFFDGALLFSGI